MGPWAHPSGALGRSHGPPWASMGPGVIFVCSRYPVSWPPTWAKGAHVPMCPCARAMRPSDWELLSGDRASTFSSGVLSVAQSSEESSVAALQLECKMTTKVTAYSAHMGLNSKAPPPIGPRWNVRVAFYVLHCHCMSYSHVYRNRIDVCIHVCYRFIH